VAFADFFLGTAYIVLRYRCEDHPAKAIFPATSFPVRGSCELIFFAVILSNLWPISNRFGANRVQRSELSYG
jgi:hypothetical protein